MALVDKKTLFITGANGFLGANLLRRLIAENKWNIHVLLREKSDLSGIKDLLPLMQYHYGDLKDADGLKKIVYLAKPSGIFHLAASNILSGVTAPYGEVIESNFIGTANLLKALEDLDYDFFINTGSFLEYGKKNRLVSETDLCEPSEVYSLSKLAGTLYAQSSARLSGKPIITFRVFTPYGPYVSKGRLTYEIISKALAGEDIHLTSSGVSRDFIFADDIIDLFFEASEKARQYKGEIFNLGSGKSVSIGEVADHVLKRLKSKSKIMWGSFRSVSYDSDFWQANMSKTFASFSWRPKTPLAEGIDATISWFKSFIF